jgi:hypothetical protein
LACGNGTDPAQHPLELFGDDWVAWSKEYMMTTSSEVHHTDGNEQTAGRRELGPLHELLGRDHARLDACLRAAAADGARIGMESYAELRAGLLRHIAIEEKIVIPTTCRLRGAESLAFATQLRADHAALASLLVPTPTHTIIELIAGILVEHNPLEKGEGGLYDECERLVGAELVARTHRGRARGPTGRACGRSARRATRRPTARGARQTRALNRARSAAARLR